MKTSFTGSFSFSRAYSDAPNPFLSLGALGSVGLPLSVREAAALKAHCAEAPFGMGERTVIDKAVRDTWEMDAALVAFQNAAWGTFMENVVKETCEALGVSVAASRPRAELYKLLLYETGSQYVLFCCLSHA
jgi:hypothetical protein